MEIKKNEKSFLKLLLRSPDEGDGWRKVSSMVWPLVESFGPKELIETKDSNMVRLSERGLVLVDYM